MTVACESWLSTHSLIFISLGKDRKEGQGEEGKGGRQGREGGREGRTGVVEEGGKRKPTTPNREEFTETLSLKLLPHASTHINLSPLDSLTHHLFFFLM